MSRTKRQGQAQRFSVLALPDAWPALFHALRAAGHQLFDMRNLQECIRSNARRDAILIAAEALPRELPQPLPGQAVNFREWPCIVLVGLRGEPPAWLAGTNHVPEFIGEAPCQHEVEALLRRLAWRRSVLEALHDDALAVRSLESRLRAAAERSERLIHRVSHAAQAVLRYIASFAQRLEHTAAPKLEAREKEHLRFIQDSARGAHAEIQDLVTLAQLEQAEVDPVPLRLADLVAACIGELGPDGAHVSWSGVAELPAITADEALLRLALKQLLRNAALATRETAHPAVEITAVEQAGGTRIEVRDNGIGFGCADVSRLFEAFEKLHTPDRFPGRGMGLSFVKAVAERHSGSVDADVLSPTGAVFGLWLPLVRRDGAPQSQRDARRGPHAAAATTARQRVLLVDDDELVLATLRQMLERLGNEVWTAGSGEAALEKLQARDEAVDAVVVDWSMPGLDGIEVATRAKSRNPRTTTILLSGRWGTGEDASAVPDGVDHVLAKPVSLAALQAVLPGASGRQGEHQR